MEQLQGQCVSARRPESRGYFCEFAVVFTFDIFLIRLLHIRQRLQFVKAHCCRNVVDQHLLFVSCHYWPICLSKLKLILEHIEVSDLCERECIYERLTTTRWGKVPRKEHVIDCLICN